MKDKLNGGNIVYGSMLNELYFPNIVHMYKNLGYDFCLIDCEHGTLSYGEVGTLVAMARAVGLTAIVRIPEVRRECVLKYLDLGADGLLCPMVDGPEMAAKLVNFAKYPPEGIRGVSIHRPHSLYNPGSMTEYIKKANERTMIFVQIELKCALEAVDEIASVEGLDGLFIGPSDLSMDLGIFNELSHPLMKEAVKKTASSAAAHGIASGVITSNKGLISFAAESGMKMICAGSETRALTDGLALAIKDAKSAAQLCK